MSSVKFPHQRDNQGRRVYPKRFCLVDNNEVPLLRPTLEQKFHLPVIELHTNNNQDLTLESGTIYVLNEFENSPFLKSLQDSSPDVWIIGQTRLDEMMAGNQLRLRRLPTYCMSMDGLNFHLNIIDNLPLMRHMTNLIKWMGGHFVRTLSSLITHMVTNSSRAKGYHYCSTFLVPILSPQWVEYCWQQRNILGFKADLHTENFKLPAFADIRICFKGFKQEELTEMAQLTKEHGGSVVSDEDSTCTHMVFNDEFDLTAESIVAIPSNIYLVIPDWFWASLDIKGRAVEENYQRCVLTSKLSESYSKMDVSITQHDSKENHEEIRNNTAESPRRTSRFSSKDFMEDKTLLQRKDAKKKLIFEELLHTEQNYIRCLSTIVNIKYIAMELDQPGGSVLNSIEAKEVFGNFEELLEIHQNLAKNMEKDLNDWNASTAKSMHQFIKSKYDIMKQYEIYSQNIEQYQEAFKKYEDKNHRFRKLTASYKFDNQNLKDLYVRPLQRLCSVFLLLKEIKKNNREKSDDNELINKAANLIEETLSLMNENKRKCDKLKALFDIYYLIKNCPPDLITSHRELIARFSAKEIIQHNSQISFGITVTFFLFNDVLLVTKMRKTPLKPLKYLITLSLCMLIKILHFTEEENGPTFGFVFRDITEEDKTIICCFKYADDSMPLVQVLQLIASQISLRGCSKSADHYVAKDIPLSRFSVEPLSVSLKSKNSVGSVLGKLVTKSFFTNTKTSRPRKIRKSVSCSDLDNL